MYGLIDGLPLPSSAAGVDLTVRPLSEKQVIAASNFALSHHMVHDIGLAQSYQFAHEEKVHAAAIHMGVISQHLFFVQQPCQQSSV